MEKAALKEGAGPRPGFAARLRALPTPVKVAAAIVLLAVPLIAIAVPVSMARGPHSKSAIDWAAAPPVPDAPDECPSSLISSIVWGGAASAYQIEGAWDADGKGPSIWDVFTQKGGETKGNATGDVAIDHYHRWREDLDLMQRLGLKTYRFSVAWARIVPSGLAGGAVNPAGIAWYKNLVTELLKRGIVPAVTLFHWDLPQELEAREGGFLSNSTAFQDAFLHYADTLFRELGPQVKLWMTFNEPLSICELGYNKGIFAPGIKGGPAGQYRCGHNLLLAHARAVDLYRRKYQAAQGGRVSIPLDGKWGWPYEPDSAVDRNASQLWMEFQYGWMADPLYFGDYPPSMRAALGPLLPAFTANQSALLKGAIDYFAVQFYCGYFIQAAPPGAQFPYIVHTKAPNGSWVGPPSASEWLFTTPAGLRGTLVWLDRRYSVGGRKVEFTISENGVSGPGEAEARPPAVLRDDYRLAYYRGYIGQLCRAIVEDGVKFTTYWAWSVFDNFEWRQAFTERFGLVYVDLENNLTRTPKASAYWFAKHLWGSSAKLPPQYYASA